MHTRTLMHMPWFAAHLVSYIHFSDGRQSSFPVHETIYLIHAETPEKALARSETVGRNRETELDGSFTWMGRPAQWRFAGVRKLRTMRSRIGSDTVANGEAISYSEFSAASLDAVQNLAEGRAVTLTYQE